MAWSTGRARERQSLGHARVLGKAPAYRNLLASCPGQKLQEQAHEKFVHRIGPTRRPCRKAKKAARQWRSRRLTRTCNTERVRQAEAAVVPPATAHCLPRSSGQRRELGNLPCDTEELRLHTLLKLGRHLIFAGATTQAVISLSSGESEFHAPVRGACTTLALVALMLDWGLQHAS